MPSPPDPSEPGAAPTAAAPPVAMPSGAANPAAAPAAAVRRLSDGQALALLGGYLALRSVTTRLAIVFLPWFLANAPEALPLMRNSAIPVLLGSAQVRGNAGSLIALGAASMTLSMIAGTVLWWAGARFGPVLAQRAEESGSVWRSLWNPKQVAKAHEWVERWGWPAIVVTRVAGILFTPVSLVAGASGMRLRRYAAANAVGSLVWVSLFVWMGVRSGDAWPWLPKRIESFAGLSARVGLILLVVTVLIFAFARRGPSPAAPPAAKDAEARAD